MKKRLPRKRTATAVAAAVLLFGHAVIGVYAVSQQDASADHPLFSTAASSNKSWWKAAISDYDASLSLVQYEEVEPTPEDLAAQQDALKSWLPYRKDNCSVHLEPQPVVYWHLPA